jgi:hypothetical protein
MAKTVASQATNGGSIPLARSSRQLEASGGRLGVVLAAIEILLVLVITELARRGPLSRAAESII